MPTAYVGECMTTELVTVGPDDPLRTVAEMVLVRRLRHIPVVDGAGHLVGIVTDRDVKRVLPSPLSAPAPEEYDAILDDTRVARVMTKEPYVIKPLTTVADAVRTMLEKGVGGLPVLEDGRLVGLYTQVDALKGFLERLDSE